MKFNFKLKIVAASGGLALSAWSALIDTVLQAELQNAGLSDCGGSEGAG